MCFIFKTFESVLCITVVYYAVITTFIEYYVLRHSFFFSVKHVRLAIFHANFFKGNLYNYIN